MKSYCWSLWTSYAYYKHQCLQKFSEEMEVHNGRLGQGNIERCLQLLQLSPPDTEKFLRFAQKWLEIAILSKFSKYLKISLRFLVNFAYIWKISKALEVLLEFRETQAILAFSPLSPVSWNIPFSYLWQPMICTFVKHMMTNSKTGKCYQNSISQRVSYKWIIEILIS